MGRTEQNWPPQVMFFLLFLAFLEKRLPSACQGRPYRSETASPGWGDKFLPEELHQPGSTLFEEGGVTQTPTQAFNS